MLHSSKQVGFASWPTGRPPREPRLLRFPSCAADARREVDEWVLQSRGRAPGSVVPGFVTYRLSVRGFPSPWEWALSRLRRSARCKRGTGPSRAACPRRVTPDVQGEVLHDLKEAFRGEVARELQWLVEVGAQVACGGFLGADERPADVGPERRGGAERASDNADRCGRGPE